MLTREDHINRAQSARLISFSDMIFVLSYGRPTRQIKNDKQDEQT